MSIDLSLEHALKLDREDPLGEYERRFYTSEEKVIYLDGNSLGRLPERTRALLDMQIDEAWGTQLIRSWNDSWIELPKRLGSKLASLIGAKPNEVIFTDATSVNLYKLAYAALKLQEPRLGIISDTLNFPSDIYILQGVLDQFSKAPSLRLVESKNNIDIPFEEIQAELSTDTAILSLSLVNYKSSYLHPIKELTAAAHDVGALVIWDLSHAVGAVEIDLGDAGVDMAVGCSYKYLNGGPGAPAFLYVNESLQNQLESPIKGWFGDARPFQFETEYKPAEGIQRFSAGTPPILSLAAIEPGLDLLHSAGMNAIREKSKELQTYFLKLFDKQLTDLGFSLGSPKNPEQRGSHLTIDHPHAGQVCQALINPEDDSPVIIPDFRPPESIRIGLAPLNTSFQDLWITVHRLVNIIEEKEYLNFPSKIAGVS